MSDAVHGEVRPDDTARRRGRSSGLQAIVAGIGNVLRTDDGFGPAVAEALAALELPSGTEVTEVGIGGMHLVQQLMGHPYDAVIIVDAVDRGGPPGEMYVLDVEVPDPTAAGDPEARPLEVDLHQTDPSRIMLLARSLDALPARRRIVGCQPGSTELGQGLTPHVGAAVEHAARRIAALLWEWAGEIDRMQDGVRPRGGDHD